MCYKLRTVVFTVSSFVGNPVSLSWDYHVLYNFKLGLSLNLNSIVVSVAFVIVIVYIVYKHGIIPNIYELIRINEL